MEEQDLQLIFNAIESGKCLAFLGAGTCTSYEINKTEEAGLPTGKELAEWLAEKCQYTNGPVYDLQRVSEYFVYSYGGDREPLEKALKQKIQISCKPRPIHTVLSQLTKVKIVITSNYDTLLENELTKYGRKLTRHVYNPLNPRTGHFRWTTFFEEGEIVLHKMHGSIDEPGSLVITRSDYIEYLANLMDIDRGMPEYFRKIMIPQCTLLFLGYSLEDWNFQVIWRGVLTTYANRNLRKDAYAIIKNPPHQQKKYWSRQNIDIFDGDITEFAIKLAEHFNLEIPQLGIENKPEAAPK